MKYYNSGKIEKYNEKIFDINHDTHNHYFQYYKHAILPSHSRTRIRIG